MSTEIRFLLAVVLMIAVLIITNLAFPPIPPEDFAAPGEADSVLAEGSGNRQIHRRLSLLKAGNKRQLTLPVELPSAGGRLQEMIQR